MRSTWWMTALGVTLGFVAAAPAQLEPSLQDRQVRRPEAQAAKPPPDLRQFLSARVPEVDWDDLPFEEVVEWLRELGGVNVVVRWNVLLEQGIDEDSPVSLRLKDATVSTILGEALAQLSEVEELRYQGIGNTLTISTRTNLNRRLYVRTYRVDDLLARVPEFTEAPEINLEQGGGGGGGPGGGSAQQNPFQGGSGGGGEDEDRRTRTERVEDLIDVIKETVEPESWIDAGGYGEIKAFNDNFLVVRASLDVHVQLGGSFVLGD